MTIIGGSAVTPSTDVPSCELLLSESSTQYNNFEWRILAVRGDTLNLSWTLWSDDAGNETAYLHVFEIGDDGRIIYAGRFDEDDFEGAYRELGRRYRAGEGAAFAEVSALGAEWLIALNNGDFDRVFGELTDPGFRVEIRSASAFPDRSAAELRASFEDLNAMVSSARSWNSAERWLDSRCGVVRHEREAVGLDGEQYAWSRLCVFETSNGRAASLCEFRLDDEASAFAYAEERARATSTRLAVTNRASKSVEAGWLAMRSHDVDGLVAVYSDRFDYDDRRRLSGDPIDSPAALRVAAARILEQYPNFEWRILAVRGERLELHRSRWSDDAGNETTYLHVVEIGDDARITYDSRFDEDDFEGAYCELDGRYYAGEGAAFAAGGALSTEIVIATNRGDFDWIFDELILPDLQVENRSLSGVQGSSATDLRAAVEGLDAMVASVRVWNSAVCWLSPTSLVARYDREAIGQDGERYEWTFLLVGEFRDGRLASVRQFDIDNEESAFAYAEERMRATDDSD